MTTELVPTTMAAPSRRLTDELYAIKFMTYTELAAMEALIEQTHKRIAERRDQLSTEVEARKKQLLASEDYKSWRFDFSRWRDRDLNDEAWIDASDEIVLKLNIMVLLKPAYDAESNIGPAKEQSCIIRCLQVSDEDCHIDKLVPMVLCNPNGGSIAVSKIRGGGDKAMAEFLTRWLRGELEKNSIDGPELSELVEKCMPNVQKRRLELWTEINALRARWHGLLRQFNVPISETEKLLQQ